jgi:hydroxymethylbilane synthase
VPFRGNVATRLQAGGGRGGCHAAGLAGLNRLGQADAGTALDGATWLPAAGQAPSRWNAAPTIPRCRPCWPPSTMPTAIAIRAERALLAALGGNCHSALAAHATREADGWQLAATLFSPDGADRVDGAISFARMMTKPPRALPPICWRARASIASCFDPPR